MSVGNFIALDSDFWPQFENDILTSNLDSGQSGVYDSGETIAVDVAAPHWPDSIWLWVLGGLALIAALSQNKKGPISNPPSYSKKHPVRVSGYRTGPYYRRKRRTH